MLLDHDIWWNFTEAKNRQNVVNFSHFPLLFYNSAIFHHPKLSFGYTYLQRDYKTQFYPVQERRALSNWHTKLNDQYKKNVKKWILMYYWEQCNLEMTFWCDLADKLKTVFSMYNRRVVHMKSQWAWQHEWVMHKLKPDKIKP